MKVLIMNSDYPEFLSWHYAQHPGLDQQPYDEQMRVRMASLFGVADFYSRNLRKLGHEAWDVHANNEIMQKRWAKEHGLKVSREWQWGFRWRRGIIPWVSQVKNSRWIYEILAAQIIAFKPDVLINQHMYDVTTSFLKELKPYIRLLVGQIASPVPEGQDLRVYDLIISSLPNFVNQFRTGGVASEVSRLAFEPTVLERLEKGNRDTIAISFVGSISRAHQSRIQWLENICSRYDVKVWGNGINGLADTSHIRRQYVGEAWSIDMYNILRASKVTLNNHIDVADGYANNLRLFEATGVGALLLTDWKKNIHDLFEPEKEVVTYRTVEECAEKIQYFLDHDDERAAIAQAGHERTLREHTYHHRMQELVDIIRKYI